MASHASCNHEHHSAAGMTERRVMLSLCLTFTFVVVEFISGLRSNSLALLSDSGHNFSDGLALLLSWYALRVARKPATPKRTYGFHRVGILTALFNALTLLLIALFIFVEAYHLFLNPTPVSSSLMMGVAAVAFVLNTGIAVGLHGEALHDVNVRSAYVHMMGDAISSIGVIIAGAVIHFTNWRYADPLVSVLIGLFIVYSSVGIVRETITVLLEGAPSGLDVEDLVAQMRAVIGVSDVHDLHVWTIANEMNALSCHLTLGEETNVNASVVVAEVKALLRANNIPHSTIETECGGCENAELYCQLDDGRSTNDHHHHHHSHGETCTHQ